MGDILPKPLVCPECGESGWRTRGGLYWHIKIEHEKDSEEAYQIAGDAEYVEIWPR